MSSSTNALVQNVYITEALGAYGIKHQRNFYTQQSDSEESGANFKNITIDVPFYGGWEVSPGHQAPNFTIEAWKTHADNTTYANCTLTNGMSLSEYNSAATKNYDIGYNAFLGGGYPIELKGGHLRIHHNIFNGLSYGVVSRDPTNNLTFDYNLVEKMGSFAQQAVSLGEGGDNNTISNNTIVSNASTNALIGAGPGSGTLVSSDNWVVKNNIFKNGAATIPSPGPDIMFSVDASAKLNNLTLGPNLYWGIQKPVASSKISFSATTPGGDTGPTADPVFSGGTSYPDPQYRATASAASGFGAYSGSTIDVGNHAQFVVFKSKVVLNSGNPNTSIVSMTAAINGNLVINRLVSNYAVGTYERFGVYYNEDKSLSIRSSSSTGGSNFVTVNSDGHLNANSTSIAGSGQKFTLTRNGDGTVSFRSVSNGMYVTGSSNGDLLANASTIGTSQKFEIHAYDAFTPVAAVAAAQSAPASASINHF